MNDEDVRIAENAAKAGEVSFGASVRGSIRAGKTIYKFVPEILRNVDDSELRETLENYGIAGLRPYGGSFDGAYRRSRLDGRVVPDIYPLILASSIDGVPIKYRLTGNSISVETQADGKLRFYFSSWQEDYAGKSDLTFPSICRIISSEESDEYFDNLRTKLNEEHNLPPERKSVLVVGATIGTQSERIGFCGSTQFTDIYIFDPNDDASVLLKSHLFRNLADLVTGYKIHVATAAINSVFPVTITVDAKTNIWLDAGPIKRNNLLTLKASGVRYLKPDDGD